MKKIAVLIVLGLAQLTQMTIGAPARAAEPSVAELLGYDSKAFGTISRVTIVEEAVDGGTVIGVYNELPWLGEPSVPELDVALVVIDKIIATGRKIWDLIAENKPVVSVDVQAASALPQGANDWRQLEGWKMPESRIFRVQYENVYGITMVDFAFRVLYTYGGTVTGKGSYLSRVVVLPHSLDVRWGMTFNAKAEMANVVNVGSRENPVAGMEVLLKWSVDSIVSHSQQTQSFFVTGLGEFKNLSNGT